MTVVTAAADTTMCVYVIGAPDGPQKIGIASRVEMRLRGLQNGNPLRLAVATTIPVTRAESRPIEAYAHFLLRSKRLSGEWFAVNPTEACEAAERAAIDVRSGKGLPATRVDPEFSMVPVTSDTFRQRLRALGHTLQDFAALTGIDPATVRGWGGERSGRGLQPFPAWVGLLLTAWERQAAQRAPEAAA